MALCDDVLLKEKEKYETLSELEQRGFREANGKMVLGDLVYFPTDRFNKNKEHLYRQL